MPRRRWLPANVTSYKDRHGKTRYRFRKQGTPTYHFKAEPGTPEFMAEYHAAKSATPPPPVSKTIPFTYDELIESFYRTTKWQEMRPSGQATYRGIIERFRKGNGHLDVREIVASTVDAKLASMADTPAAANNLRKILARLHQHAIRLDWRRDNPIHATDPYRAGKGWHCWTEDELDKFDQRWAFGTRERLAKELLLETALRKSDVLLIGKQHRKGDVLELYHTKNDSETIIPIGPDLAAAMAEYDAGHLTYLVTAFGKPFTPTGFYNWFKRACVEAGIDHCSPHGLRKAASRRLAESGATSLQGRAITGHKTDREFAHYAEQASKRDMAHAAVANLHRKFAKSGRKTE